MAQLVIRDLNYTDTGTLICAYNGTSDLEAIDQSSKIHLFVEDKKHLLKYSGFDYLQDTIKVIDMLLEKLVTNACGIAERLVCSLRGHRKL